MESIAENGRKVLTGFLDYWPLSKVQTLTLDEYIGTGNRDTFCQHIETKTKPLGSINGVTSIKFGIFKRRNPNKRPIKYKNDNEYSWKFSYGDSRNEVFHQVLEEVCGIINHAQTGDFERIDDYRLTDVFKWKIAYLYSNERLVSIFKKEVLIEIAKHYGHDVNKKTKISALQEIIISKKPPNIDIYKYSDSLYAQFGRANNTTSNSGKPLKVHSYTRREQTSKSIAPQKRSGALSYIAEQQHNLLQNKLLEKLRQIYGEGQVKLELNYVDITLELNDSITFYEIKSDAFAVDCIRKALGQVLSYAYFSYSEKKKKIIVAGQYPPNEEEMYFINYIKQQLEIEFSYEQIDLH